MRKVLQYLSLLLPLLIAMGLLFITSFLSISVYYNSYICSYAFGRLSNTVGAVDISYLLSHIPDIPDSYLEAVIYIYPVVWAIFFYFWYRRVAGKASVTTIKRFTAKNIIILLLISIGCQLVISAFMELVLPYFEKLAQDYSELIDEILLGNPILVFVSTVILAPVSEELIFRGVILKKALRFAPFLAANIAQALLFGIFHLNIVQGVYALGVGLVLGFVAYRYQSIICSILLHMFFNAYNYVAIIPTKGVWIYIDMAAGAVILTIALIWLTKTTSDSKDTIIKIKDVRL